MTNRHTATRPRMGNTVCAAGEAESSIFPCGPHRSIQNGTLRRFSSHFSYNPPAFSAASSRMGASRLASIRKYFTAAHIIFKQVLIIQFHHYRKYDFRGTALPSPGRWRRVHGDTSLIITPVQPFLQIFFNHITALRPSGYHIVPKLLFIAA